VHADFPASAIDFIHRSGRTGRAGAGGVVTSLVGSESVDLAEAIKELMEGDDPLEGAFSRNRSFRKKHKKYGRFVKRGEVG
jgi:superfamily II DNA/RNA helicase